jgi:hypothetical protein
MSLLPVFFLLVFYSLRTFSVSADRFWRFFQQRALFSGSDQLFCLHFCVRNAMKKLLFLFQRLLLQICNEFAISLLFVVSCCPLRGLLLCLRRHFSTRRFVSAMTQAGASVFLSCFSLFVSGLALCFTDAVLSDLLLGIVRSHLLTCFRLPSASSLRWVRRRRHLLHKHHSRCVRLLHTTQFARCTNAQSPCTAHVKTVFCVRAISLTRLRLHRRIMRSCTCRHATSKRQASRQCIATICIVLISACCVLGGLGYSFDSTNGFPGEGPEQQVCVFVCVCVCVCKYVCLCMFQEINEQIRILKQLRHNPLGTGEAVYVASLGNKLHMSFATVKKRLEDLGVDIKKHGRWPAITTPDSSFLDAKFNALGVDTTLLKPMSARVNAYYHKIDAIVGYEACRAGQFRFNVAWSSPYSHLPDTVCCHDLNSSARVHVRVFCITAFHCVRRQPSVSAFLCLLLTASIDQ